MSRQNFQWRNQVHYTGYMDQQRRHETWCKSPHPYAVVECTCPASATLGYQTPLETMSADQYDRLYKPAPMPTHKLKAIRHKRHVLRPRDPSLWPKDRLTGEPKDPLIYGYPPDWLEDPKYERGEYDLFDPQTGAPIDDPRAYGYAPGQPEPVPWHGDSHASQHVSAGQQYYEENKPVIEARKTAPNFWEVDLSNPEHKEVPTVTPEQAQRWHNDPNYQEQEYTPEQLERAARRAGYIRPNEAVPPVPVPPVPQYNSPMPPVIPQPAPGVYPTAYPQMTPAQQQQYLSSPPVGPQACRAVANVNVSGVDVVVVCTVENEHPNQPHMAKMQAYGGRTTAYMMWSEN